MRYADVIWNDIAAGDGLCVSFYTQGCPHHCPGCHNQATWDFEGGKEFPATLLDELVVRLNAQGIHRPLCILGGEPLCNENLFLTNLLVSTVKEKSPHTKIIVWTGYEFEELQKSGSPHMKNILANVNTIVDGPYIKEQRDVTLKMRGSHNQRIIDLR